MLALLLLLPPLAGATPDAPQSSKQGPGGGQAASGNTNTTAEGAYDPLVDAPSELDASSASSAQAMSSSQQGTLLFSDDFNAGFLDSSRWTVVNPASGVQVANGRLEAKVTEQVATLAVVRGADFTTSFDATHGVDASVQVARHVAGSGFVARPDLRVVSSDGARWIRLFYDPYYGVVRLSDSQGHLQTVSFNGASTGYHAFRIVATASGYTGSFDAESASQSTTLFDGVAAARVELQEQTGGSSYGFQETSAWDDVAVSTHVDAPPSFCDLPGPDAGGYTCDSTPYDWVDPSGGTSLPLSSVNSYLPVALPFPFAWYGTSRTTVRVSASGLLCFDNVRCDRSSVSSHPVGATPNDFATCLWKRMAPENGGSVSYKAVGVSPDRALVVTFDNVPNYNDGAPNTFQAQIRESGEVRCMYAAVASTAQALSGTEDAAGATGVRYAFSLFSAPSLGVRFSPPEGAPPATLCELPGPDAGGYRCTETAYAWQDPSGGSSLSLGDDDYAAVALPFSFPWYGVSKATVYVGSNGLLCFTEDGCDDYWPVANPDSYAPNDFATCLWKDLNPSNGGSVTTKTVGASPNRAFVVTFDQVPDYYGDGPNTFQAQLLENGEVRCMYGDLTPTVDALAGTEDAAGTAGVRYSFSSFLGPSYGVRFAAAPSAAPPSSPQNLAAAAGPGNGQILLTWQAPASDGNSPITGYAIYRGEGDGPLSPLGSVGASLAALDSGLPSGTTFRYQVAAVNAVGEGAASNEASATTFPPPQVGLALSYGPGIHDMWLTWHAPDGYTGPAITGYNIYRGTTALDQSLWTSVGPDTTWALDQSDSCGTFPVYTLTVVTQQGEGPASAPTSEPGPSSLDLLCLLDGQPFYWGPVRTGNLEGPPDAAPQSLEALHDGAAGGALPEWYYKTPSRWAFGLNDDLVGVEWDHDTLQHDASERSYDLAGETAFAEEEMSHVFARASLINPAQFYGKLVEKLQDLDVSLTEESAGVYANGEPYQSPTLGAAAIPAVSHAAFALKMPGFEGGGGSEVGATLYADPATRELRGTGLDQLVVLAQFSPPSFPKLDFEYENRETYPAGFSLPLIGEITAADALVSVKAKANLLLNGAAGVLLVPGTTQLQGAMGGIGLQGEASLDVDAHLKVLDGVIGLGGSFETGVRAGLRTEGVAAGQFAPGQVFVSPYSHIQYRDLDGWPVLVFMIDPSHLDETELKLWANIGIFHVSTGIHFDPQDADAFALAMGHGTLSGSGIHIACLGCSTSAAAGAPAAMRSAAAPADGADGQSIAQTQEASETETLDVEPGEDAWQFAAEGDPGSSGDVTLSGYAAVPLGDTWEVRPWSFTLPGVEAGPEGSSALFFDALGFQAELQDAARHASFEDALAEAASRVDLNGDGQPDATFGVPADARAPTLLRFAAPDGAVGEPFALAAAVADAAGSPVTTGSVDFLLDGELLGSAALDAAGNATVTATLPATLAAGDHLVQARFAGTSELRAASASRHSDVQDRAPRPVFTSPSLLQAFPGSGTVALAFGSTATDLDAATAQWRVDGGAWQPADPGPDGFAASLSLAGLAEGAHRLEARLADLAGNVGEGATGFAVDDAPPAVAGLPPRPVASGGTLTVPWTASEPVVGHLAVRDLDGNPVAEAWIDEPAATGAFQIAVPDGTYHYTYDFMDMALNAISGTDPPVAPSAPTALAAVGGAHDVVLDWQPPADDGGAPIGHYTVYAGDATGTLEPLATVAGSLTTFTEQGLGNAVERRYRVSASNAAGEGPLSDLADATTADVPSAPLELQATAGPGKGTVTLSWSPPASDGGDPVVGYRVYAHAPGQPDTIVATLGTVLAYADTGLPDGAERSYRVAAVNGAGEGGLSEPAAARAFDVPAAPTGLSATPGIGEVRLAWSPPPSNGGAPLVRYVLTRTGDDGATDLELTADSTAHTDAGLPRGASFAYRIAAVNVAGTGPSSDDVRATTFDVPSAPEALTAVAGVRSVRLTWSIPASDGGSSVLDNVLERTGPDGTVTLRSLGVTDNATDGGLQDGASYTYRLVAVNAVGQGAWSAAVQATVPTAPLAPQALQARPGVDRVRLRWDPPASDGGLPLLGYHVFRKADGGAEALVANVTSNAYVDRDATGGSRYTYWVTASNAAGEGPRGAPASARPSHRLLDLPAPLDAQGVRVQVCESPAAQCPAAEPGLLCATVRVAPAPPSSLACVPQAAVPPTVRAVLRQVDVKVPLHAGGGQDPPGVRVSYTYDAAHLRQAGAACLPAGPAEADWLLRSDGLDLTVETGDGSASIPYLGQLVAAAQATLGVVPCGG